MTILRAFAAAVALMAATAAAAAGCGLNTFVGRSGDALQFWVVQGDDPPARFSWRIGEATAIGRVIPRASVPAHPGTGRRSWAATRDARGSGVDIFEVLADGTYRGAGRIDAGASPLAMTWAEDAHGAPWLFLEIITSRRVVSVWRGGEAGGWVHVANVDGELMAPRAVGDEIRMNHWRLTRDGKPLEAALPAPGELVWFHDGAELVAVDDAMHAWTSSGGGTQWQRVPAPADARLSLVWSDDDTLAVSWSAGPILHVARWTGGQWEDLAAIDKRQHDAAGPIVIAGGRVVALALCYRTTEGGAATKAVIADHQRLTAVDVSVVPHH